MGCGHSKNEVETSHTRIKVKHRSKKTKETNNNQPIQCAQNEEIVNEKSPIEELICDGMSGKTEYFSPKRSNVSNEKGKGNEDFNEGKEREIANDHSNRDLSIEGVICDGMSGKTEYYSPKRSNKHEEKEGINDDGNGNRNLSVEGLICDGFSGKSEHFSPKKSSDVVEVEDKEVLVEGKTGETGEGKIGKTEEGSGDGNSGKTEFSSPKKSNDEETIHQNVEEIEFYSLKKASDGHEVKELLLKGKESGTGTTVHVSGFAFNTLLGWWRTREI